MSDKLIRQSDAIDVIKKNHYNIGGCGATLKVMIEQIKAIPSADRPQGEWELSAFQNDADVANGIYAFICTNCEHTDIHALSRRVPYCWWCGARMKGADDE